MNEPAVMFNLSQMALTAEDIQIGQALAMTRDTTPRISLRGSRFNFVENGEIRRTHDKLTLDVVVVGARPAPSRKWYAKVYDGADTTAPDCSSIDGKVPDGAQDKRPDVLTAAGARKVQSCAECPKNIAGSAIDGKGRACSYYHRIAVVSADVPENEVWAVDISALGIFGDDQPGQNRSNFRNYGTWLQTPRNGAPQGIPMHSLVTRLGFDAAESVPVLRFGVATSEAGQAEFLNAEAMARVRRVVQGQLVKDRLDMVPRIAAPAVAVAPAIDLTPPVHVALAAPAPVAAPAAPLSAPAPVAPAPVAPVAAPVAPVAPPAPMAPPPAPPAPPAPPPAPVVNPITAALAHPEVPQTVRDWAAHPQVTEEMVAEYLRANLPQTLTPAAPAAPAAPVKATRQRRTAEPAPAAAPVAAAPAPVAVAAPVAAAPVAAAAAPLEGRLGSQLSGALSALAGDYDEPTGPGA